MKNKKLIEDKNGLLTVNIPPSKRELDNFIKIFIFKKFHLNHLKKNIRKMKLNLMN